MPRILLGIIVASLLSTGACKSAGGEYASSERGGGGGGDRGETNGASLDFVSNRPEGDSWEIRVRGSALSASYSSEEEIKRLPTINLDRMQTEKVWRLIDDLELSTRKKGKKDEDDGFVTLVLREPGGEDGKSEIHTIYISRTSEDEELEALALYLQDLIERYHKVSAEF